MSRLCSELTQIDMVKMIKSSLVYVLLMLVAHMHAQDATGMKDYYDSAHYDGEVHIELDEAYAINPAHISRELETKSWKRLEASMKQARRAEKQYLKTLSHEERKAYKRHVRAEKREAYRQYKQHKKMSKRTDKAFAKTLNKSDRKHFKRMRKQEKKMLKKWMKLHYGSYDD